MPQDKLPYSDIKKRVDAIIGEGAQTVLAQMNAPSGGASSPRTTPRGLRIFSPFSPSRTIKGVTKPHRGADIVATTGTPVAYNTTGKVIDINTGCQATGPNRLACGGGFGNNVLIQNQDGSTIRLAHLSKVNVRLNQSVSAATTIGLTGNTGHSYGAHLHVEYIPPGSTKQVDPAPYLDKYISLLH